jgi:hypothetical protein
VQVIGVDAAPIVALVKDEQIFWNRRFQSPERETMSALVFPLIIVNLAISSG